MIDTELLVLLIGVAIAAGVFGGVLAGLLGVGGGIVIVPALYLALSTADLAGAVAMQVAVATSLATIVFTAASSARAHHRRGAVDRELLRRWSPWVILGVVAGSFLGAVVNGRAMVAVFATVAGIVSLNMLIGRGKIEPQPRTPSPAVFAATGVAAGGISAMMGIGGGTVCVPLLSFQGYDIRRAVGTSSALGLIIGLPATWSISLRDWAPTICRRSRLAMSAYRRSRSSRPLRWSLPPWAQGWPTPFQCARFASVSSCLSQPRRGACLLTLQPAEGGTR